MALCKNCAIISPSLPPKQKDKYVHFPNFSPISCCSLAFHFTLRFSLFIDDTEEGGRRPLLTGTNLSVCVHKCVTYSDVDFTLCTVVGSFPEKSNSSKISVEYNCDLNVTRIKCWYFMFLQTTYMLVLFVLYT